MDILKLIIEAIEILAWPVTILGSIALIAIKFNKPFSDLIRKMTGIEYIKDKDGHKFKASFLKPILDEAKEKLQIPDNTDEEKLERVDDPKFSILSAYKSLEQQAAEKLKGLKIDLATHGYKGSPLDYLLYKGAFSPEIESAVRDMQLLRNQVSHSHADDIAEVDARGYLQIADRFGKMIDALDSLPAMNLNAITMILRNISVLMDSNKYFDISINDVHEHIEDGTILDFIASLDEASELKSIMGSGLWSGFEKFYVQSLQSIYHGYAGDERRKWGIENSGLCLLLAWTNEIIQMGSGWYPNTNLSELD